MNMRWGVALAATAILATAAAVSAQTAPPRPTHDENGVVHAPAFDLPPSAFMSDEAVDILKRRAHLPNTGGMFEPDVALARAGLQQMLQPQVDQMLGAYPADISETTIAGVPARVFTPREGRVDQRRVLINLHGGAFQTCWESCSILESAPIAVVGGYRVISLNYRMAPEHTHPAGVEDVAAVYRDLLQTYRPENIGIYGCSAGGALTAQSAAWFATHDLPQPAAIGIFGAGAVRFGRGDSAYVAGYIDGTFPPPPPPGAPEINMTRGYFEGAQMDDAVISPAMHPEVIARFPPTLIITGTRAMDMSPAIVTNSRLIKAGVSSTLIVGEGMGHCYFYVPHLPESHDAYAAISGFFHNHLGQRRR